MEKEILELKNRIKELEEDIQYLLEKRTADYSFMKHRINDYLDYKERNEAAIKHIKQHQLIYQNQYEDISGFDNHLLDILEGKERSK